jgi:hypothetical protein
MAYLSLPDFNTTSSSIMTEYNDFTEQVATALPTLKEIGFGDPTFCIQLGLLPKAKLRLRSSNISDENKVAATTASKPNWPFTNAIVNAAKNAKKIQNLAKLDTVVIDADFSLPPRVRMYFLNGKADLEGKAGRDVKADLDGTAEKGAKTKLSIAESDLICGP